MSRRIAALKPQLNRIRAWAHEGSTDAWIAHQLDTSAESVRAFRQEHGIERGGPAPLAPITPDSVVEAMLAEEAAALEAGPEPEPAAELSGDDGESPPEAPAVRTPRRRAPRRTAEPAAEAGDGEPVAEPAEAGAAESDAPSDDPPAKSRSRRGARGGAGRSSAAASVADGSEPETVEDADGQLEIADADADADGDGDDERARSPRKRGRRRGRGRGSRGLEARLLQGSVLLLDPSVAADAAFQEHWQNAGPLRVEVSADTIVLRRIVHAESDGEHADRSPNT